MKTAVARAKLHRSPSGRCFYHLYDGILCVVSIGRLIGCGRESSERWSLHDLPLVLAVVFDVYCDLMDSLWYVFQAYAATNLLAG